MVDGALRLLEWAPARTRGAARLGLRVLERSTFPGRFSRLSLERRAARIESLEQSGSMNMRNLILLLKGLCSVSYARAPEVQQVVGSVPRCELGPEAEPPPLPPHLNPAALEPPEPGETLTCDVAVVGSGAGGAAAAAALAEAGLDVVVLEAGRHFTRDTYPRDPIEAIVSLYREGGITVAEGRPPIPVPVGRAVGGTTVINSGTCFRAPNQVLRQWREPPKDDD